MKICICGQCGVRWSDYHETLVCPACGHGFKEEFEDDIIAPPEKTILQEAAEAVGGPRRADYGDQRTNFARIARIASAMIEKELTPADIVKIQYAVKLGRLLNKPDHRDSIVDIAGYSECLWEVVKP